jgi:hypothetical protein
VLPQVEVTATREATRERDAARRRREDQRLAPLALLLLGAPLGGVGTRVGTAVRSAPPPSPLMPPAPPSGPGPGSGPGGGPMIPGIPLPYGGTGGSNKPRGPGGCECKEKKPKSKSKRRREVCYKGTYIETPTTLIKQRKEQVPCQPSSAQSASRRTPRSTTSSGARSTNSRRGGARSLADLLRQPQV